MPAEPPPQPAQEPIDLKNPAMAALLAWLVPGLGHWYQGRRAKAVLYFVCILGLFVFGVYLSSSNEKCLSGPGKIGYGRAAYFSWREGDRQLLKTFHLGVGLPSLVSLLQAERMGNHRKVFCGGLMAPPRLPPPHGDDPDDPNLDQPTPHDLHRQLHRYLELAGFFTMVAGLLNVLAIYDAWAGPVPVTPLAAKKEETSG